MTYWQLNAIFLAIVTIALVAASILHRRGASGARGASGLSWPAVGVTLAVLLIMTAVFDNVMISIGLVAYNDSLISGAFIGVAPLEDFAYAIAAVVGLPSLWVLLGRRRARA